MHQIWRWEVEVHRWRWRWRSIWTDLCTYGTSMDMMVADADPMADAAQSPVGMRDGCVVHERNGTVTSYIDADCSACLADWTWGVGKGMMRDG